MVEAYFNSETSFYSAPATAEDDRTTGLIRSICETSGGYGYRLGRHGRAIGLSDDDGDERVAGRPLQAGSTEISN